MFDLSVGIGELVVRSAAVYIFLFVVIRWLGKKQVGELAPFDLIVLLIISETVQNAMIGDDKSLLGGLVCAGTVFALAQLMNRLSWSSKRMARLLEGTPKILIRHGSRCKPVMDSELVTISELTEALRRHGCTSIAEVRLAVLENDGSISVIRRKEG